MVVSSDRGQLGGRRMADSMSGIVQFIPLRLTS